MASAFVPSSSSSRTTTSGSLVPTSSQSSRETTRPMLVDNTSTTPPSSSSSFHPSDDHNGSVQQALQSEPSSLLPRPSITPTTTIIAKTCSLTAQTMDSSFHSGNQGGLIVDGNLTMMATATPKEWQTEWMVITGMLRSHQDLKVESLLLVEGWLEGNILSCGEVVIAPTGCVVGNITCEVLVLHQGGEIHGEIQCQQQHSIEDETLMQDNQNNIDGTSNIVSLDSNNIIDPISQLEPTTMTTAASRNHDDTQQQPPTQQQQQQQQNKNNVDVAGNPLMSAPPIDTVNSYRLNRQISFETQRFLSSSSSSSSSSSWPSMSLPSSPATVGIMELMDATNNKKPLFFGIPAFGKGHRSRENVIRKRNEQPMKEKETNDGMESNIDAGKKKIAADEENHRSKRSPSNGIESIIQPEEPSTHVTIVDLHESAKTTMMTELKMTTRTTKKDKRFKIKSKRQANSDPGIFSRAEIFRGPADKKFNKPSTVFKRLGPLRAVESNEQMGLSGANRKRSVGKAMWCLIRWLFQQTVWRLLLTVQRAIERAIAPREIRVEEICGSKVKKEYCFTWSSD